MKKKLLSLLLASALVLGLTACGGEKTTTTTETTEKVAIADTPEGREAQRQEIRHAIGLLLDRNYIVNEIAQGGQVPASSFVAMGMTNPDGTQFYETAGHSEDYHGYFDVSDEGFMANFEEGVNILRKYYDYDEATGKFTNFPTLTYLYNTADSHKAIAEYIQAALDAVGITINLENQEWNTFLNTRKNGQYSIARNGWVADYNDPICFLDMWTTASGNNDAQFGKGAHKDLKMYDLDLTPFGLDVKVEDGTWAETYDVLIGEIKACGDPETRYSMMHLAEDMLMETGGILPLYFNTDLYMLDDSVEGFFTNPLGFKNFSSCSLKDGGKSMSVCLASEPDTLDPALNSALDGGTMDLHLFSGLSKWALDENGKLAILPDAAEELVEGVQNEDGTVTYTYTLREGMKWSDGKPVTASDFVFAWQRAASVELAADYGYMFDVIDGYDDVWAENAPADAKLNVKALDDRTLEVTLANNVPYWNELLAFPCYLPVREDVVSNEKWATDPSTFVSNGAYTIESWDHNSLITLKKNPDFYNAENVKMDELKFYLSDNDNNMLSNFENGSWQMIDSMPVNEIPNLKTKYPDEFFVVGLIGTYYTCWNMNEEILPG